MFIFTGFWVNFKNFKNCVFTVFLFRKVILWNSSGWLILYFYNLRHFYRRNLIRKYIAYIQRQEKLSGQAQYYANNSRSGKKSEGSVQQTNRCANFEQTLVDFVDFNLPPKLSSSREVLDYKVTKRSQRYWGKVGHMQHALRMTRF